MRDYDVIVVGLGAMGSAVSYQLASRGARVLGLEQFDIPHGKGSSHGFSRVIRKAYNEHPDYVPLLHRSYELWDQLEAQSGQKILHRTGGLYMGRPESEAVAGALEAARLHKLPHELLTRTDLARRYPQFHLTDDFVGVFEPDGGFLVPELAIATHCELAMRRGAELHGHEAVTGWSVESNGVRVVTPRETYTADKIIFCGGAWSDRLVRELGVPLVVTRQTLGWLWPRKPDLFKLGTIPVWQVETGLGGQHYGFPMMPDNPGLKVALHKRMEAVDPDTVKREPMPGDEATFRPFVEKWIPDGAGPLLSLRVCLYVNSPDFHFIMDVLPGSGGRVSVACGFSGHGFKFASVVGEIMADLALRGRTELPVEFLSLARFKH